jgi:predicted nucleotidyltransferase
MATAALTGAQAAALRAALAPPADRIERVDLFGSRATGRGRPSSAVDLMVRCDVNGALLGTALGKPVTVN